MTDTPPRPTDPPGRAWESPEQVDALNPRFLRSEKEPPPVPATDRTANRAADAVTVFGGLLLAVSAFLPWLAGVDPYGNTQQLAGFEVRSDAPFALGIGAAVCAAAIAGLVGSRSIMVRWGPTALGILTVVAAIVDLNGVAATGHPGAWQVRPGIGLWLMLIAGGIVLVAGLATRSR